MNISEYKEKFPSEVLPSHKGISDGMLLFDESASSFAGPFKGNYAYYCIKDGRLNRHPKYPIQTLAALKLRHRLNQYNFPFGMYRNPSKDLDHLQQRLDKLTPKELKEWQSKIEKFVQHDSTIEKPFLLYICGNDDCSYTKYYPTLKNLEDELNFFLDDEPLNFGLHISENGFVFTN